MTEAEKKAVAVRKRRRLQRDSVIVAFTLAMATFEIILGGARPSVFTFLGGLLLSPLMLRYDEARKEEHDE